MLHFSREAKTPLIVALLAGILLPALLPPAHAAEEIRSFHSRLDIHRDGSVRVTETITVRAEGEEIKRGIYRDFPTQFTDYRGNRRRIDFEVLSVKRNGKSEPYHTEALANGVRLYVGREDRYLDPGEYQYTITYETDQVIEYFEDHDELYWNVTGTKWNFPIQKASATVTLPKNVDPTRWSIRAFAGPEGSREENYEISNRSPGRISLVATTTLPPGHGFTLIVGWPRGIVEKPGLLETSWNTISNHSTLFLGILGLLGVLGYYLVAWNDVGRDPSPGEVVPRSEPPDGLSPAACRYVMEMGFDNDTYTSSLVNLAVEGHVEIEQDDGEFVVRKKKNPDGNLTDGERAMFESLFNGSGSPEPDPERESDKVETESGESGSPEETVSSDGRRVELTRENRIRIKESMRALENELEDRYRDSIFVRNTEHVLMGVGLSILVVLGLGWWHSLFTSGGSTMLLLWFLGWSIAVGFLLAQSYTTWRRYLRNTGSGSLTGLLANSVLTGVFLAVDVGVCVFLWYRGDLDLAVVLLGYVAVNMLFYELLKAPTDEGRELMDKIAGFKRYLTETDRGQLEVERRSESGSELYERLLPYAVALGVGNAWARSLSDALNTKDERRAYHPAWFAGHDPTPDTLASDVPEALSSSLADSTSSSSGSGGGGGSAGGGAGGGGGGGW